MSITTRWLALIILLLMIGLAPVAAVQNNSNEYSMCSLIVGLYFGTSTYFQEGCWINTFGPKSLASSSNYQGRTASTFPLPHHNSNGTALSSSSSPEPHIPEFKIGPGRLGLDLGLGRTRTSIPASEIVRAKDVVERLSGVISDLAEFGLNTVTASIGFVYRLQAQPVP